MLSADQTRLLAIAVLIMLLVALFVWIVVAFRRTSFTVGSSPLYLLNLFLGRVLWRTTIVGEFPMPAGQGAVVVCNHRGPIDPGFIGLTTNRPVHWLVAKEYFSLPIIGPGLRSLQCIPVGRAGIDTAATKLAIRYAQRGDLVGLFPEGRINTTDQLLLPGRPGAAMIALKTRVPVVPCYISGSPNDGTPWGFFFMAARVRLIIGRPIDLSEYYQHDGARSTLEDVTRLLLKEIAALAGVEDYPAEIAGKRWRLSPEEQAAEDALALEQETAAK